MEEERRFGFCSRLGIRMGRAANHGSNREFVSVFIEDRNVVLRGEKV
jgi:hypothetical protein